MTQTTFALFQVHWSQRCIIPSRLEAYLKKYFGKNFHFFLFLAILPWHLESLGILVKSHFVTLTKTLHIDLAHVLELKKLKKTLQ